MDWLTVQIVADAAEMALPASGTAAAKALDRATKAAKSYIERRRKDIDWTADDLQVGDDLLLGAALLANRYYQRRNSPLGTVGSPDLGLTQILRTDPDITALLRLNRFTFSAARSSS